jgi:hypothetical protein
LSNANRRPDRYADQRDDQQFDDRTFQPLIPVQILNPDYSTSGPAAAESDPTTRYETDSTHVRSDAYMQRNFGPQLTSFRAPTSQNPHLPIADTTMATSTQGRSTSFAGAQELLPEPHHQSHYRHDNNQTVPTAQSQSSQQYSGHQNTSHHTPLSPKLQVSSSLSSQAARRVDTGHLQYPHSQHPIPHQGIDNESQNDRPTQSSHNPLYLRPTPGITDS